MVGCGEGVVYLMSAGHPTDIGRVGWGGIGSGGLLIFAWLIFPFLSI